MCPRKRSRGYTLVEVLVAFMILAMALTVLLRIFASGVRTVSVSAQYAQAVLIVKSTRAYYVTVTVTWPNGDRERSIDLSTVKLLHDESGS